MLLEENIVLLAAQRLEELESLMIKEADYENEGLSEIDQVFIRLSQLTELASIPDFGLGGDTIIKLQAIESKMRSLAQPYK